MVVLFCIRLSYCIATSFLPNVIFYLIVVAYGKYYFAISRLCDSTKSCQTALVFMWFLHINTNVDLALLLNMAVAEKSGGRNIRSLLFKQCLYVSTPILLSLCKTCLQFFR